MRLLFEKELDELISQGLLTVERKKKFFSWVTDAAKARSKKILTAKENQYDKAEELLTWYTFAPLVRMSRHQRNEVICTLLKEVLFDISFKSDFQIFFEKIVPPPKPYLKSLEKRILEHPVRYIRQEGERHRQGKLPLEGETHIDLLIESEELLIPIEAKFTSDISHGITYDVERNQIARIIDVTIEKAKKSAPNKKIIFLLCVPKRFLKSKSRLYSYKLEEYKKDLNKLQGEIEHRSLEELELITSIGAITWEKAIEIIYGSLVKYNLVSNKELKILREFYSERKISFLAS